MWYNQLFNQRNALTFIALLFFFCSFGQGWQQKVEYFMDVDFDVTTHQYTGTQKIVYTNNSPDVIDKAFFHLYLNAFQPGSMMDMRSRTIDDPDGRVADRIFKLAPEEIGYQRIKSLKHRSKPVRFQGDGTVLEVTLTESIKPGETTVFEMEYEAQVPKQIRRTGRNNREGIDYSMSQWYPKLSEYDEDGWHPNPYIGREFYGVWGDFDVKINIDASYILGGSGVLQNASDIGYGYQADLSKTKEHKAGKELTWHFKADNVHDFMWAADRDYTVKRKKAHNGTMLYFLYQPGDETNENWGMLPDIMDEALRFMNDNYGVYPYPVYSFIQGGDGGMEYPMATLITGNRSLRGLVGVSVHEWMHSWYQMVLGTNESLYPWMDEGFTSYASSETMNYLREQGALTDKEPDVNPHASTYAGYVALAKSGREEPLSTHADHFTRNRAYGTGSYSKGSIFLNQLGYIIGQDALDRTLLRYFDEWKFKHPDDKDFLRIAERESDMVLDWYREYWVNTTKKVDYAVYTVNQSANLTTASLFLMKEGGVPMPLDLKIDYADGSTEFHNIPIGMMRGDKSKNSPLKLKIHKAWNWTHPFYLLEIDSNQKEIISVEIDPLRKMADVNRGNNKWLFQEELDE